MTKYLRVTYTGLLLLLALLVIACVGSPTSTPQAEPAIPSNFTTYTYERLFSISYPPDWIGGAPLIMGNQTLAKQILETEGYVEDIEGQTPLFVVISGKFYMRVSVELTSIDYSTLDEVVKLDRANTAKDATHLKELSVQKTTVDSRDAVIIIYEGNIPDSITNIFNKYNKELGSSNDTRFMEVQLYTVKGDYIWSVICGRDQDYEDTLMSIVRSFRLLD